MLFISVEDPTLGAIGRDFLNRLESTQSEAELVPDPQFLSSYVAYGRKGFLSKCIFNRNTPEDFAVSLVHQGNLALAWSKAAILHANPANPLAPAIPIPEDFARIVECATQDTYAKQAWMASLAAKIDPVFVTQTRFDPVSAKEFEAWRKNTELSDALVTAACAAMKKPFVKDGMETFADLYHREALMLYETQVDWLKANGFPVRFMRMEDDDIRSIGDTFGPNILPAAQAQQPFWMNAENAAHAAKLSTKYDIGNYVPSFSESLTAARWDRARFLAVSKSRRERAQSFTPH